MRDDAGLFRTWTRAGSMSAARSARRRWPWLAGLIGLLAGLVTPGDGAAQERSGTLLVEVKNSADAQHTTTGIGLIVAGPVTVEHASTGQVRIVPECVGWCVLDGLDVGAYRVTVEVQAGERFVVSGVPVTPNRQTHVRVDLADRLREVSAAAVTRPITRDVPGTLVAVLAPDDVVWPVSDACTTTPNDDTAIVRMAGRGLQSERTALANAPDGVWVDLRRWWGGLVGTTRDPNGHPLGGVPVTLEFLDADGRGRALVAPLPVRSDDRGCYGLAGLWPGRYRVTVDYPPFAVVGEVLVQSERRADVSRLELPVQVVSWPADRGSQHVSVDATRLGRRSSIADLRHVIAHPARVAHAADDATRAMADVRGVVVVSGYDPQDWPHVHRVPDVQIIYEHVPTGERRRVFTARDGFYQVRLPAGEYRVLVDEEFFRPLDARVVVTPEGHAALSAFHDASDRTSGVHVPGAVLRAGLLGTVNLALLLEEVSERARTERDTVTVVGRPLSYLAPPLAMEVTRPDSPDTPTSLWSRPLSHHAIAGRTVQAFHPLTPGIVYTESTGSLAQFTATGQRRFANRLTIDGMSADLGFTVLGQGIDEAGSGALPALATSGSTQTLVPGDAIDRVQILTTHVPSELARTPGAQTTIVTRSGPDHFTGTAFAHRRPQAFSARDVFEKATGTHRARQWSDLGIAFGGPVSVPRVNYWIAYEQQQTDRSVDLTMPVPSLAVREMAPPALRPLLNAFPRPNGPDLDADASAGAGPGLAQLTTTIPATSALSVLSGRVDTPGAGRVRGFVRGWHGQSEGDALTQNPETPFLSFDNTEATGTTGVTAGVMWMGTAAMHDVRVNLTSHRGSLTANTASYGDAEPLPTDLLVPPGGPASDPWARLVLFLADSGAVMRGRTGAASQRQVQVLDTWTFARGAHTWKLGVEYRHVTASTHAAANRYTYRFPNIDAFLHGRPRSITFEHTAPARVRLQTWSAFAQDDVRLSSRLSLHYGLRYSVKPAPTSLTHEHPLLLQLEPLPDLHPRPTGAPLWHTSWTDLAPRAAVTYGWGTASGRERTVRAGWALTFDEVTSPGASAFGRGFPYAWQSGIRPSTFPVPVSELTVPRPASFTEAAVAEAYAFPVDLRSPRTQQWHLGLDQALGRGQRLAVAYVGTAARQLPYWHVYYPDGHGSQAHTVQAFSADGRADYHALLTEYARQGTGPLQARLAYTWSHAIDTDSGESRAPNLPPSLSPPSTNRASADFDRRHVLFALASYELPMPALPKALRPALRDWRIDVAAMVQSGAPVTILSRRDIGRGPELLRPDVRLDVPVWVHDPSSPTGRRINAAAFSVPTAPRQGDLGRNTVRASALRQVDLSLVRSLRRDSRVVAAIRVDVFNVFNTTNVGPPQNMLGVSAEAFGRPYQSYAQGLGTGTASQGGLAPMQQPGGPRAVQVGVEVGW